MTEEDCKQLFNKAFRHFKLHPTSGLCVNLGKGSNNLYLDGFEITWRNTDVVASFERLFKPRLADFETYWLVDEDLTSKEKYNIRLNALLLFGEIALSNKLYEQWKI